MENEVCPEKQDDFRNSVQCLEGWILKLFKEGRIDGFDKDVGMLYLKKIAICSKLNSIGRR